MLRIPGSDVALNGGASWRRLLAEVEVAVRLAHPPEEHMFAVTLTHFGDNPSNFHSLAPSTSPM